MYLHLLHPRYKLQNYIKPITQDVKPNSTFQIIFPVHIESYHPHNVGLTPPAHMARWRLHGARHRTARSYGTDSFTRAAHHIGGWSPFSRRCARIIRYRKIPSTTTDEGEQLLVGIKGADREIAIHGREEGDSQQPGVMGRILNEVGRAFSYGTISL